jgi:hypothetical protein
VSSPETIQDIILTTNVTQLLIAKELLNPSQHPKVRRSDEVKVEFYRL